MAPVEDKAPNGIVLYNYGFSPFGKRVSGYLALRGLEYAVCVCFLRNCFGLDFSRWMVLRKRIQGDHEF